MEKLNVSVILPIKSSKTLNFDDYFNKAIQSIKNQKLGINELSLKELKILRKKSEEEKRTIQLLLVNQVVVKPR